MEFNKTQKRFLDNKHKVQILKGEIHTGKTLVALYKCVNLENNYCIYKDDKVGFITSSKTNVTEAKKVYSNAQVEMENEFYSLFSIDNKSRTEFTSINDLVDLYYKAYIRENKLTLKYARKSYKLKKIKDVYEEYQKEVKLTKFLSKVDLDYLLEEIEWIKASAFTQSEYLKVLRKGRKRSIKTESISREQIYKLCEKYSFTLNNCGYMDKFDEVLFAIKKAKFMKKCYTHVIVDDAEKLTRSEFKFIDYIRNKKYGMYFLIINRVKNNKNFVWASSTKNMIDILGDKHKSIVFKNKFSRVKAEVETVEKFEYKDIVHSKVFHLVFDTASLNDVVIEDKGKEILVDLKNTLNVNVYNDIAAGNPIEMNDLVERKMSLPKNILGNEKEVFMLRVKGDSMIDKDIDNGDFVVIKKQNTAYHNQIVAVDIEGSATLKTLNLNSKRPVLMPANEKYEPIELVGRDINILGILLGVMKKKQ
ncbi:MAG: LexA family protein [Sarcina sp.]